MPLSSALESCPHLSPTVALGRAGPVLYPDNTVEPVLVAGVWMSQLKDMSVGDLTRHLSAIEWQGYRGDVCLLPLYLNHFQQSGKLPQGHA